MANLSIKDVPEPWAEALRQRAARNHRSLQGELMAIVEQAVQSAPASAGDRAMPAQPPPLNDPGAPRIVGFDRQGFPIVKLGWKTAEQVAAEMKAKYPEPLRDQLSSVQLIREDRDSR